ncbi:MAG: GntR family transcriptional regulator [Sulfuriferula multivorans]|uniref:GntR family transcriptional regulator n=1 Tax=Sulfuriferula multivorans TaxID=1559896 RepID=A0A7C9K7L8_9PROT|nr:GntR family transcriptional regulator [Sulfuriferula multivorans]
MSADVISIPRAALHEQVAHRLRQMLVENRIAPGAKLNERELSEVLKVSRTPLREAIKMLATEGLVELLPNRGAIAVELSEQDILDTFEVMAGLEAQSGELAAMRITDAELDEIKAMHYEMLAAYTRRDLPAYYRLNAAIHQAINTAAKNPVLSALYKQVNSRLQSLRFRSNQDGEKWRIAVEQHEQMVQALGTRDAEAMRAVLLSHMNNKRFVVIEQIHGAGGKKPASNQN